MARISRRCDKEDMKMTLLKQEETFRQQVQELHRLYGIQKTLMRGMKDADSRTTGGNCGAATPEEDLDLTLSIGGGGGWNKRKLETSATSESRTSMSSSSSDSGWLRLDNNECRQMYALESAVSCDEGETRGYHRSLRSGLQQHDGWFYHRQPEHNFS